MNKFWYLRRAIFFILISIAKDRNEVNLFRFMGQVSIIYEQILEPQKVLDFIKKHYKLTATLESLGQPQVL